MRMRILTAIPLALILTLPAGAAQLRQIAMIDIPGQPGFDGVAIVNGFLLMTHAGAGTVDVFNMRLRRLEAQVKGLQGPAGIAADPAGAKVYVANSADKSIAVISTRTWKVLETITMPNSPQALVFAPERRLYAADWLAQSLSAVDLAHGDRIRTTNLGGRPQYMVYDPQRQVLFVTLQDLREVVALDPALEVVSRYKLAGSLPTGVALNPKSRRLYVAVRYAVIALDADSGAEVGRVAMPAGTDMLWFDPGTNALYAAAGNSVSVINTGGNMEVVGELPTEVHGHVLAFDPATRMVYLPGGREGRSKLLILKRIEGTNPRTEQVAQDGAQQKNSSPPR